MTAPEHVCNEFETPCFVCGRYRDGTVDPTATETPAANQDRCPTCGSDPTDDSLHRDGCARINTCGQMGPPWIDPPWHPDPPGRYDAAVADDHRREAHGLGPAW